MQYVCLVLLIAPFVLMILPVCIAKLVMEYQVIIWNVINVWTIVCNVLYHYQTVRLFVYNRKLIMASWMVYLFHVLIIVLAVKMGKSQFVFSVKILLSLIMQIYHKVNFNANRVLSTADNAGTIIHASYARQGIIFLITYANLAIFPTATSAFHRWLIHCVWFVTQVTFWIMLITLVYHVLITAPFVFLPLNVFSVFLVSFSIKILHSVYHVLLNALFVIPILLVCSVLVLHISLLLLINVSVVLSDVQLVLLHFCASHALMVSTYLLLIPPLLNFAHFANRPVSLALLSHNALFALLVSLSVLLGNVSRVLLDVSSVN